MRSHRFPFVVSFLSFAAAATACGANDGGSAGAPGSAAPALTLGDLGGQACHLTTSIDFVDPASGQHQKIARAFPGDSQCITAPSTEAGAQFHYGPTNYADPVEVGKYVLPPGGEVTDCTFFVTPNKETAYFSAYHSRMRPGSHHMLLYVQPTSGGSGPVIGNNGLTFGSNASSGLTITGNK